MVLEPVMTKTAKSSVYLSVLAALAFATGCQQETHCAELADCGGDLLGDSSIGPGHPSCSEDLYVPPADKRLVQADLPPARTPPPEPAFFDWCGELVAGSANVLHATPVFYTES